MPNGRPPRGLGAVATGLLVVGAGLALLGVGTGMRVFTTLRALPGGLGVASLGWAGLRHDRFSRRAWVLIVSGLVLALSGLGLLLIQP
jgi:hypothetical protein